MQCPKCSIEMDEVRKLDVVIDACSSCGGIWLDRGELDKIRAAEAGYETSPESHNEQEKSKSHDDERHGKQGEGRKKKKRGGFLTDIMEGFGGE